MLVHDRKVFHQTLAGMGVGIPYHIGYHRNGSYSYVDAKEQLGIELSVNNQADYRELFEALSKGVVVPLAELEYKIEDVPKWIS